MLILSSKPLLASMSQKVCQYQQLTKHGKHCLRVVCVENGGYHEWSLVQYIEHGNCIQSSLSVRSAHRENNNLSFVDFLSQSEQW